VGDGEGELHGSGARRRVEVRLSKARKAVGTGRRTDGAGDIANVECLDGQGMMNWVRSVVPFSWLSGPLMVDVQILWETCDRYAFKPRPVMGGYSGRAHLAKALRSDYNTAMLTRTTAAEERQRWTLVNGTDGSFMSFPQYKSMFKTHLLLSNLRLQLCHLTGQLLDLLALVL